MLTADCYNVKKIEKGGLVHEYEVSNEYLAEKMDATKISSTDESSTKNTSAWLFQKIKQQFSFSKTRNNESSHSLLSTKVKIDIQPKWKQYFGESLVYTDVSNYIKLEEIILQPNFSGKNILISNIQSYVLQKIKMWGCNILSQKSLKNILTVDELSDEDFDIDNDDESMAKLNKIDIFASFLASTEFTVLADIFRILAMFPIALPLFLPDLKHSKTNHSVMLLSVLQKCLIRWEKNENEIGENVLFESPFKLLTAIRVGKSGTGKSQFLNRIFKHDYVFQCKGQPGGGRGRGVCHSGSVEFIWLTKDTCDETIWKAVETEMKNSAKNEIVLLANLHGDAIDFADVVEALVPITSTFIAFIMPNSNDSNLTKIAKICKKNILYFYIDGKPKDKTSLGLKSSEINNADVTSSKLKRQITNAIKAGQTIQNAQLISPKTVTCIKKLTTPQSEKFLAYVKKHKLKLKNGELTGIGSILALQKLPKKDVDGHRKWKEWKQNLTLQKLMAKFVEILQLPIEDRIISLGHVETQLRMVAYEENCENAEKLQKAEHLYDQRLLENKKHSELENLDTEIKFLREESVKALTVEDFFRELSLLYEQIRCHDNHEVTEKMNLYSQWPMMYAELLIRGRPLEILDGDMCSVPSIWIEAVCHSICISQPGLRIFVVSILGLQSSGKSTLLNALFGCKFASSIGRCTRGLYMRFIPLDEDFREKLQLDALLVIDTEGLCSPETMKDPNLLAKDRSISAFAMAISDLTLINVNGEVYKEIVDVLQIVIFIMAKMDEAEISPDLLLVQIVAEGGQKSKLADGVSSFCKALDEAIELISNKGLVLEVKTTDSLNNLKDRIKTKSLLCQVRPFKDGASLQSPPSENYHNDIISLRSRIITEIENRKKMKYFCSWHKPLKRYWNIVENQKFAHFNSIRQVQDFIEVSTQIGVAKAAFDKALLHHEDLCKQYITGTIYSHDRNAKDPVDITINNHLDLLPNQCGTNENCKIFPANFSCQYCKDATRISELVELDDEEDRTECSGLVCVNNSVDLVSKSADKSSLENYYLSKKRDLKELLMSMYQNLKAKRECPDEIDRTLTRIFASQEYLSEQSVWEDLLKQVQTKYPVRDTANELRRAIAFAYRSDVKIKSSLSMRLLQTKPELRAEEALQPSLWGEAKSLVGLGSAKEDAGQALLIELGKQADVACYSRYDKFQPVFHLIIDRYQSQLPKSIKSWASEFCMSIKKGHERDVTHTGLQILYQRMKQLQLDWDAKHNQSVILINRRSEIIEKIQHLLKPKISVNVRKQTQMLSKKLLDAIKSVSIENAKSDISKKIKDMEVCQEKMRIYFFADIAEQVHSSQNTNALQYFLDPQKQITEWYNNWLKDFITENFEMKQCAEDILDKEYLNLKKEIEASNDLDDLLKHINLLLNKNDDFNLLQVPKETEQEFKQNLISMLEKEKQNQLLEIDKKDYYHIYNNCKDNLGCTATCPQCGAICFGSNGHDQMKNKYRYHFGVHQPKGLIGKIDKTGELEANICQIEEKTDVTKLSKKSKIGKTNQWINNEHLVEEYSILMKWFFFRLNPDLANSYKVKETSFSKMTSAGFDLLENELPNVLSVMLSKKETLG